MTEVDQSVEGQSFLLVAQCLQLRRRIALSSSDLIELTYNDGNGSCDPDKFVQKLEEFNHVACQLIEQQKHQQAAVYLDEAQKILEYSAGCGKTIERTLITTILNNQACLLQRTSEFEQSSNYLEAIIYNINEFIETCPPPTFSIPIPANSPEYCELATYFERKIALALYHLRFCALSSHSKNNQVALQSARRALVLLRETCLQQNMFQVHQRMSGVDGKIYYELAHIKQIDGGSNYQVDMLLAKACECIQDYNKRLEDMVNPEFQDIFQGYSIGSLMQATPLPLQAKPNYEEFMRNQFSNSGRLFRVVHVSMAYFTIATELRLISLAKYSLEESQRLSSVEYRQSKAYHLVSIILIARYLNCKSVFLTHAIYSFNNHYGINLHSLPFHGRPSVSIIEETVLHESRQLTIEDEPEPEHEQTMEIHESKQELKIDSRPPQMAEIQNKVEMRKLKTVRSKQKSTKLLATESSRAIETERSIPTSIKYNKENKSKLKLLSKSKDVIRSRRKDLRLEQEEERKGLYYGNVKSRSKSKRAAPLTPLERKTSKKGMGGMKSGIIFDPKKQKAEHRIEQEYGIKSLAVFPHKVTESKVKKAKQLTSRPHNFQSTEQQNTHHLKFHKITSPDPKIKKMKSPRTYRNQGQSKRKTMSKDKYTS